MEADFFPPHILQSEPWGDFKTEMGTKCLKAGDTIFTLHHAPLGINIGYCPKPSLNSLDIEALYKVGKENNCSHIRLDSPNWDTTSMFPATKRKLKTARNVLPLTTFVIDLTRDKQELMENLHHKTRYNIKLARKKGVEVKISENIEEFIEIQKETASRQGFFLHPDKYYRNLYKKLTPLSMAFILTAYWDDIPLASYMLFKYGKTLYYPYGGSLVKYRNMMANNLLMWESILLGQQLGCTLFDMWGGLKEPADVNDPWYGFNRFKQGYNPTTVNYPPSHDLVINSMQYYQFKSADSLRWFILNRKR